MTNDEQERIREQVRKQYELRPTTKVSGQRSGDTFQKELDVTHASLLTRRLGAIYRHGKETVMLPPKQPGQPGRLVFKKGGNPVDYTGHINYRWIPSVGGARWVICPPDSPGAIVRPVVFDAKREGSNLSYNCRDVDGRHQLVQLRDAAAAGAWSFLLVHCVAVEAVFIIHRPEYLNTLLAGGSVRLVEGRSKTKLLPWVAWDNAEGWPYAAVLPSTFGFGAPGLDRASKAP